MLCHLERLKIRAFPISAVKMKLAPTCAMTRPCINQQRCSVAAAWGGVALKSSVRVVSSNGHICHFSPRRTNPVIITVITAQHRGRQLWRSQAKKKKNVPSAKPKLTTQQGFPSLGAADWIIRLTVSVAKSFPDVCRCVLEPTLEGKHLWGAVTLHRRATLAAL